MVLSTISTTYNTILFNFSLCMDNVVYMGGVNNSNMTWYVLLHLVYSNNRKVFESARFPSTIHPSSIFTKEQEKVPNKSCLKQVLIQHYWIREDYPCRPQALDYPLPFKIRYTTIVPFKICIMIDVYDFKW